VADARRIIRERIRKELDRRLSREVPELKKFLLDEKGELQDLDKAVKKAQRQIEKELKKRIEEERRKAEEKIKKEAQKELDKQ
mgnify:CR=1